MAMAKFKDLSQSTNCKVLYSEALKPQRGRPLFQNQSNPYQFDKSYLVKCEIAREKSTAFRGSASLSQLSDSTGFSFASSPSRGRSEANIVYSRHTGHQSPVVAHMSGYRGHVPALHTETKSVGRGFPAATFSSGELRRTQHVHSMVGQPRNMMRETGQSWCSSA
eukprot:TRINITY_DN17825_c0_g3_i1.p1 TRINITY_DN17825_c0_g3~~TRINITY_DN17825_c0_g3_i1.p1  ORF type:complete len:191 (+),score=33.57 TRINITY_DN17825_c0_g3_i1:79-573(+)